MNKRIKELQVEAWDYACSELPPNALGQKNHEDYFAERFAELIIKECIEISKYKDSGYISTADVAGYMAAGRLAAANLIKKHFGVEE